jgi:hypothetical protein
MVPAGLCLDKTLVLRDYVANLMNGDSSPQPGKRLGLTAYLLAGIPFFAVSFGVCFANRDEPVLFGFPFLLTYLIFWICATPLFLWLADRSAHQ